jgi:hypothetical protein
MTVSLKRDPFAADSEVDKRKVHRFAKAKGPYAAEETADAIADLWNTHAHT